MTETLDTTTIDEIRAIIDRGLGTTKSRELIASSEVADLLLDGRWPNGDVEYLYPPGNVWKPRSKLTVCRVR